MAEKTITRWYAVYVKSKCEKKTFKLLEDKRIEVYLPLLNRLKQWSDRKKMVAEPLFKSYIFVRSDLKNYYDILNTPGVVRFIGFEGKPVPVPDNQIVAVRQYVGEYDDSSCVDVLDDMQEGQLVEIVYGEMKGLIGRFISFKGKQRLVVDIESVGCSIPINISRSQVRLL
jgi:transcription antitermination factor NusG